MSSPNFELSSNLYKVYPLTRWGKVDVLWCSETTIHKRGWTIGRPEVGSVTFKLVPASAPLSLMPFRIGPRGSLHHVHCHFLSADGMIRRNIEQALIKTLRNFVEPSVQTTVEWQNSYHERRVYVLLVAEMSGSCRLAADCLYDMHPRSGRSRKQSGNQTAEIVDRVQDLVSVVVKNLEKQLSVENSCLDEFLQDQLVVFQCLENGKAQVCAGAEPTLHTKTARVSHLLRQKHSI